MKRFSAVAVLFVAGLVLPACAQRGGGFGGGHGGEAVGHAAPAFHGGASLSAPRYSGGAGVSLGLGRAAGYGGYSGYHGGYGSRGPSYYRGPVWGGAWLGAGYLGYPGYGLGDYGDLDASGYDDSGTAAAAPAYDPNYGPAGAPPDYGAGGSAGYPAPNYAAGPPPGYAAGSAAGYAAPAAQGYRPAYQPGTASAAAVPAAPAGDEDAVTLIFKDGRPAEHIHNYAMTRTTLYVQEDQHHREIPIDELDLAATEKANREAGVSFEVPEEAQ